MRCTASPWPSSTRTGGRRTRCRGWTARAGRTRSRWDTTTTTRNGNGTVGPKTSRTFYVTEPYFDEGGSEITMVTLAVPMFDAASNFIGVATADLALDRIREMVRAARLSGAAESGRGGTNEFAYLVSRAGKIIVHPNEELMLRKGFPGADCDEPARRRSRGGQARGIRGDHDGWRTPARLLGDLAADRLEDRPQHFRRRRSSFPSGN